MGEVATRKTCNLGKVATRRIVNEPEDPSVVGEMKTDDSPGRDCYLTEGNFEPHLLNRVPPQGRKTRNPLKGNIGTYTI